MMEGAFYQEKKGSPTALAIVLLMHGAALTALALAKTEVVSRILPGPLVMVPIEEDKPPPPDLPKPPEPQVPRTSETFMDRPEPIMPTPPGPVAGPVGPPTEIFPSGPGPVAEGPPEPARPPVAEEPRTVKPARAKANLASYVSDEDYPTTAVRDEEQGTTRFRLAVGPDGKVKECSVTSSSGSAALDATTCRLMKKRAQFTPARNSRNEPTGDTYASAIKWVLPSD